MPFTDTDETIVTEQIRERIRSDVTRAAEAVALNWPLRTFISRSPLAGFEHLPFHDAVRQGHRFLGGEGYLSLSDYRAAWLQGRITRADIEWALHKTGSQSILDASILIGSKTIRAVDVIFLHLVNGIDTIDETTFSWKVRHEEALTRVQPSLSTAKGTNDVVRSAEWQPEDQKLPALWGAINQILSGFAQERLESDDSATATESPLYTVSELVDRLTGSNMLRAVNDELIKWLIAFTDEGLGDWSMPGRERGFYKAWRALSRYDGSGWFLDIDHFSEKVCALPERAEDALIQSLQRLEVPDDAQRDYLARHLSLLHGWSGYIRWKSEQSDQRHAIDPIQYLAVRLFYESELALARSTSIDRQATFPALRAALQERPLETYALHHEKDEPGSSCHATGDAWRLFLLAQHLALTPADLRALGADEVRTIFSWLGQLPEEICRVIWHEAYERRYRRELLGRLRLPRNAVPEPRRPAAQAVFCIDVRSEPFRRHFEAQGPYETIGFAGFFGVPIAFRGLDREDDLSLCPVLIKPKFSLRESPTTDYPEVSAAHLRGRNWHELINHAFHRLKANPFSSYMLIDLVGLFFTFALAGKTVLLSLYRGITAWTREWIIPTVPTTIPVKKDSLGPSTDHEALHASPGLSTQEQATVTENSLRIMGLTKNFARLVVFCGHGSTTENNPYGSAYDCGACGGNHGGPNARALARMANDGETRATLRGHGIAIPEDTVFLAAEHNTTTDRITFFDLDDLPLTHHAEWLQLSRDLEQAGTAAAAERCDRIPNASRFATKELASGHVGTRSVDWAQTRPEWGLAGNAAFIIGRRALTRNVALHGRVFLHTYDSGDDESGTVLETIMTAPLVVAEWINMQYYFSTVDSWTYGSGSKVLHNVVGGIGVMLGRHSDLQTGLPMQSVKDGVNPYHEPLRLFAIIEATTERLSDIIGRHQVLQRFFDHEWVHLLAIHPLTGERRDYRPGGSWVPCGMPATHEDST
ncbi:DUF2309 domain-containing protein [Petrachloros mirabilis]